MKNLILLTLFFSFSGLSGQTVRNVRLSVEDEKVFVRYDLDNYSTKKTYEIGITFQSTTAITPFALSGDVGVGVLGGKDRLIVWDLYQDIDGLQGNLKADIVILSSSKEFQSGPSAAFLSMVVPGLGDYFVRDNKLPALFYSLSIPTCLGVAFGLRNDYEQDGSENVYYLSQSEYETGYGLIVAQWESPTEKVTDYFSQKSDIQKYQQDKINSYKSSYAVSNYLLITGLSLYTLDVIMVVIKGIKNNRNNEYYARNNVSVRPTFLAQGVYNPSLTPGLQLTLNLSSK